MIKRIFCIWIMILLLLNCALAAEATCIFPDLEYLLRNACQDGPKNYEFFEDSYFDVYTWYYPKAWPEDGDVLLATLANIHSDWEWKATTVEGHAGYQLTNPDGKQALLVSQFNDTLLALLPVGCKIVALDAPPAPEPEPDSQTPDQEPYIPPTDPDDGGEWVWVTVEEPCAYCYGGACSLCNGTGVYRLYGQSVDCPKDCSACDGTGTYTREVYTYVP